ncbi:MAG: hypothetical protein HOV79_24425 [Hamadaea sp.]|nr:hypothetical protein [Hamadaea sp.]
MAELDTFAQADLRALRAQTHLLAEDGTDPLTDGYRSLTEIRGAYRRSLAARDALAASLVHTGGWSLGDVAHVLCGHRHHTEWAATVVGFVDTPAATADAERLIRPAQMAVAELRDLHSCAAATIEHRLTRASAAGDAADTADADDPMHRLFLADQRLQQAQTFHDTTEATRDVVGATLVAHHGWRLRQVAAIARADVTDITAACAVAKMSPPSDADSAALRELARLTDALEAETCRAEAARRDAAAILDLVGAAA